MVEAGALEAQTRLAIESLRRFGGRHARATVTAVSPRSTRRPSEETVRALAELDAEYLALDIVGACPEDPPSWKTHVMAAIEGRSGPDVIVQLDSDTLFVGDIGPLCEGMPASARPVDVKGMGTAGPDDEFEPYWAALCQVAGVDIESLPFVRSSGDRVKIRANHNGGFVAAQRSRGLFACADDLYRRGVDLDLRPLAGRGLRVMAGTGEMDLAGSEWFGAGQAVASVAAAKLGFEIGPLEESINVPVHIWGRLRPKPHAVTHVHYHRMLSGPLSDPNPLLDGSVELDRDILAWLRSRVPLRD